MDAHRVETTLERDGTLTLSGLPFLKGETVEIIIAPKATTRDHGSYSLRGSTVRYTDPFEPVAGDDWEATE
jgi:hypothetical protein